MTLKELKEAIDRVYYTHHNHDRVDDIIVCIPNNKNGMGGTPATGIEGAHKGIDWDSGKFMIYPETKMIELKE